jgi:hypothetical protein
MSIFLSPEKNFFCVHLLLKINLLVLLIMVSLSLTDSDPLNDNGSL